MAVVAKTHRVAAAQINNVELVKVRELNLVEVFVDVKVLELVEAHVAEALPRLVEVRARFVGERWNPRDPRLGSRGLDALDYRGCGRGREVARQDQVHQR